MVSIGIITYFVEDSFGLMHDFEKSAELDNIGLITASSIMVNGILGFTTIFQIFTYRKEIKNRLRPWIGREGGKPLELNNNSINMQIYNHGSMPAQNIISSHYISSEKKSEYQFNKLDDVFDMGPNESINLNIDFTAEQFSVPDDRIIYFGWKIKYSGGSKINGIYEIHGMFNHDKNFIGKIKVK